MDDADLVCPRQRVRNRRAVDQRSTSSQPLCRNDQVERFTGDVLHHDEVDALVGTDVVNRDDSGMVQGAGGLGLLDEPAAAEADRTPGPAAGS
jgi:hypothetical protein